MTIESSERENPVQTKLWQQSKCIKSTYSDVILSKGDPTFLSLSVSYFLIISCYELPVPKTLFQQLNSKTVSKYSFYPLCCHNTTKAVFPPLFKIFFSITVHIQYYFVLVSGVQHRG